MTEDKNIPTKEEYSIYLRDYRWLNKRNYIFGLRGRVCINCGSSYNSQIHHLHYTGKYPWEAPDNDLVCVCNNCHYLLHNRGEFNTAKAREAINTFNSLPNNQDRVICIKNNNFIGNFNIDEVAKDFNIKKESIIKNCNKETKLCSGYNFIFAKEGQKIESYPIYNKPKNQEERVCLLLGINNCNQAVSYYKGNIINEWDIDFILSLIKQNKLSERQKTTLLQIANKIRNESRK